MIDRGDFIRSLAAAVAAPAACATSGTRPYNVLVLGDSIAWGQGLKEEERWRTHLHDNLQRELRRSVTVYAPEVHSGAVIGIGDRDEIGFKGMYQPDAPPGHGEATRLTERPVGGEIPFSTPTILRQLDTFRDEYFKAQDLMVDLVVISAGINDVSMMRFLNALRDSTNIKHLIETHCRFHLAALLDRVRTLLIARNDKCRVIVLSYFQILSTQSTIPHLKEFISAFFGAPRDVRARHDYKSLGNQATAQEPSTSQPFTQQSSTQQALSETASTQPPLVALVAANAKLFFDESNKAIQAAVDDANRDSGDDAHPEHFRQHFYHVRPRFDPTHSLYTGSSWLWEVQVRGKDGKLVIGDSVFGDREQTCAAIVPPQSDLDANICQNAAIGHPNVNGAYYGYFKAIWEQVQTFANDAAP